MNTCCCCTNTLNLCDQNVCEGINFGITAQLPGVHKLKLDYFGISIVLEEEFIVGQEMVFISDQLNENFQYTGELYDPIGNKIVIRKGGVDYDCIKFRTVIGITFSNVSISS